MKGVLLYFLIPLSALAVIGSLAFGVFSMAKGGEFSKQHSNKLMRMRVAFQAITILFLMILLWLMNQGD